MGLMVSMALHLHGLVLLVLQVYMIHMARDMEFQLL